MAPPLNPQQTAAAQHQGGHALVLAGAGSGKTTTLQSRVSWLIEQGTPPNEILALAFTNKAAGEIRDRVESPILATTFHKLCSRIIRSEGEVLGIKPGWTIADKEDSRSIMRKILKEREEDDNPGEKIAAISRLKNAGEDVETIKHPLRSLWLDYQRALTNSNRLDFDDLLLIARNILRENEVHARWSNRFTHILVDEYQDSNPLQESILELLVGPQTSLWVVGDELQVLYRFRLAEVQRILQFQQRWAGATLYPIEDNYRSSELILQAANAVVAGSPESTGKILRATRAMGEQVILTTYEDGRDEAKVTADIIQAGLQTSSPGEWAILYRQHDLSQNIEAELFRRGIPYKLFGGAAFYARKEIKHAMALIQLLYAPGDRLSAERIAGWLKGIGPVAFQTVLAQSAQFGGNIPQAFHEAADVPAATKKRLHRLGAAYRELLLNPDGQTATLLQAYRSLRQASELIESIGKDNREERLANLSELENVLSQYEGDWRETIELFLQNASLQEAGEEKHKADAVSLSTIHAAKGMEWPNVFVIGLEQETYVRTDDDREDARRLLHVAITRARDHLWLSTAQQRFQWGNMQVRTELQFLKMLPESVARRSATVSKSPYQQRGSKQPRRETSGPALSTTERARVDSWLNKKPIKTEPLPSFTAGASVRHPTFGQGVVLEESDTRVVVQFEIGRKTLAKAYAKLEKG